MTSFLCFILLSRLAGPTQSMHRNKGTSSLTQVVAEDWYFGVLYVVFIMVGSLIIMNMCPGIDQWRHGPSGHRTREMCSVRGA